MPLLKKSHQAKIINVSSDMHFKMKAVSQQKGERLGEGDYNVDGVWDLKCSNKKYDNMQQYAVSKFFNVLFTIRLQAVLESSNASTKAVSIHPGFVDTNFGSSSEVIKSIKQKYANYMLTPQNGCKGVVALCNAKFQDLKPGEFYN